MQSKPFIYTTEKNNNTYYAGLAYEVLDTISSKLNFTYDWPQCIMHNLMLSINIKNSLVVLVTSIMLHRFMCHAYDGYTFNLFCCNNNKYNANYC